MVETLYNFFVFALIEVMFVGVVVADADKCYMLSVLPNGKAFEIPNIRAVAFQNGTVMPILNRILYMIIMSIIMMAIAYISFSIGIFEMESKSTLSVQGKREKK